MAAYYSSRRFNFIAVSILGGLSLVFNHFTAIDFKYIELVKNKPAIVITGINLNKFAIDGSLLYKITAASASQYPDSHVMHLSQIDLSAKNNDHLTHNVSSHTGWIDTKQSLIYLYSGVTATVNGNINIATPDLLIDVNNRIAKTQHQITITQQNYSITGIGCKFDYHNQAFTIESQVNIHYQP